MAVFCPFPVSSDQIGDHCNDGIVGVSVNSNNNSVKVNLSISLCEFSIFLSMNSMVTVMVGVEQCWHKHK